MIIRMNNSLNNGAISTMNENDSSYRNLYKKINCDIWIGEGNKFKPYNNLSKERYKVSCTFAK